jgi:hypothetical protein
MATRCLEIESADIFGARMRHIPHAVIARLDRAIQGGFNRSSQHFVKKEVAMEARGRGVLDPPLSRRMTSSVHASMGVAAGTFAWGCFRYFWFGAAQPFFGDHP